MAFLILTVTEAVAAQKWRQRRGVEVVKMLEEGF
jgi:hypothetical protein